MTLQPHRLSINSIQVASKKIDPAFLNTPQYISDSLSERLNLNLVVKVETLNPVRCFKGRGTEILVSEAKPGTHFFCASAGNFGQALAYSCRKRNLPLTVYASTNANPYKVSRMRSLGAEVLLFGDDFDSAKLEARKRSKERSAKFVEDGFDIETLEGASTIGLELLGFPKKIDAVLIPLGNGALFNGIARIVKHKSPAVKSIAIQAGGASAMIDSWRSGTIVSYDHINTIADGIAVRIPVPQALEDMMALVDGALLVGEDSIVTAMQLIYEHLGIVAEPSAAVGIAALIESPASFKGLTVATIITGGNLTAHQRRQWLGS